MKRLRKLLESWEENEGDFTLGSFPMLGKIPKHYKRISVSMDEAKRLATIGAMELLAAFNMQTYFTQAVMAGAMLSGDFEFDKFYWHLHDQTPLLFVVRVFALDPAVKEQDRLRAVDQLNRMNADYSENVNVTGTAAVTMSYADRIDAIKESLAQGK